MDKTPVSGLRSATWTPPTVLRCPIETDCMSEKGRPLVPLHQLTKLPQYSSSASTLIGHRLAKVFVSRRCTTLPGSSTPSLPPSSSTVPVPSPLHEQRSLRLLEFVREYQSCQDAGAGAGSALLRRDRLKRALPWRGPPSPERANGAFLCDAWICGLICPNWKTGTGLLLESDECTKVEVQVL